MPDVSPPLTGPSAILHALQRIDVHKVEAEARDHIKAKRVSKRPGAIQALNIIEGLKRNKLQPADLMITKVPIVPPAFRPYSMLGSTFIPGDANELYKDMFDLKDAHKDAQAMFGENGTPDETLQLYDSVKAVYGYGDPVKPKTLQRGVSGFLSTITGTNPKYCYSADTQVLTTDRGWLRFEQLRLDDVVLTYNAQEARLEEQDVCKIMSFEHHGELVSMTYGSGRHREELLVTDDHRMWSRKLGSDTWGEDYASEWKDGTARYLPRVEDPTGKRLLFTPVVSANVKRVKYDGLVWCCSVPNSWLVVRRLCHTGTVSGNSWVQRKLLSKPLDNVGRGVIVADADLGLDEVGIPEGMAWTMYAPWIQRKLVRSGMSPRDALQNVKDKSPWAKKALDEEVTTRPVIYSRAPSWHKFNVISGHPKLIKGDAIALNPYVSGGLNADYDGDRQIAHVMLVVPRCMTESDSQHSYLTQHLIPLVSEAMQAALAYNTTTHVLGIIDLQDFPRGPFLNRVEGENGPIDFHSVPEGIQVVAYDERTGQPCLADVKRWSSHPGRVTELVHLHTGAVINTDDDPRAVYGMPTDSPDLTPERTTPSDAEARKFMVPYSPRLSELIQQTSPQQEVPFPGWPGDVMPLTWDTGYWLGAMAGDGWWSKQEALSLPENSSWQWQWHIADLKGYNAARVQEIMRGFLGDRLAWERRETRKTHADDGRYGDTVKYTALSRLYGESICRFLSLHLDGLRSETHSGSGSKKLPAFAYTAPREFREGVLCGLIDTDGTACVSNAKNKPQLMVAFSSTSLKLIRDVQLLCRSLDVLASYSFSKNTVNGNVAWQLALSSTDCKRIPFLNALSCPWKRDAFTQTPVAADSNTAAAQDLVPLPMSIIDILSLEIGCPRLDKKAPPELQAEAKARQVLAVIFSKARKDNACSRQMAQKALTLLEVSRAQARESRQHAVDLLRSFTADSNVVGKDEISVIRMGIKACAPVWGPPELYRSGNTAYTSTERPLKDKKLGRRAVGNFLRWFEEHEAFTHEGSPLIAKWAQIVDADTVRWARIERVEKTGVCEDGYDLTVPGYETFMSADGVILSNTINVHLPSGDDAVKEAYDKLMPSKMLFSIRDQEKVMPQPKHEAIQGLYAANLRPANAVHKFKSDADALSAIKRGDVSLQDEVVIG